MGTITRITRIITLGWAIIQSTSIAFYLKRALFNWNLFLAFEIIFWLTTGAMIVLWISELITEYGLGNGASLLIYTNVIASLPNLGKKLIQENNTTYNFTSWILVSIFFLVTKNNYIPLRFNQSGVMPIILTTAVLVIP